MNHSFLALAAAAALCCAALPCLAEDQGAAAQASAAQDGKNNAHGTASAQGSAAPKDAPASQSKDATAAKTTSSFTVPDVTLKNCSDTAVLDQVLSRIKQAEEKSDLSRADLEAIKSFSEKCQAVLQNR